MVILVCFNNCFMAYRVALHTNENAFEVLQARDILPMLVMLFTTIYIHNLDHQLNGLLNTRFKHTQQKWFQSLEHMPTGVLIYNALENQVIFENKKLNSLFDGESVVDKY